MARLLTADEIRQLPRMSIVWIEFYNAEEGEATSLVASMKCQNGTLIDEDGCIFKDFEDDMKPQADGYWRFWNRKPTEIERAEAPWNEKRVGLNE